MTNFIDLNNNLILDEFVCNFILDSNIYEIFKINKNSKKMNEVYPLWKSSFNDEDYSTYFYNHFICDIYVCLHNNKVIGLCNSFLFNDKLYNFRYLYALCVDKLYQKRGIMSYILKVMDECCVKENIDFLFLLPANKDLYSFYYKNNFLLDYVGCFKNYNNLNRYIDIKEGINKEHIKSIYNNIDSISKVNRSDNMWDTIFDLSYKCFYSDNSYAILLEDNGEINIEELVCNNDSDTPFVNTILQSLSKNNIVCNVINSDYKTEGFFKFYKGVLKLEKFYNFLR